MRYLAKKHLLRKMYRYQFQQPKIHSQVYILDMHGKLRNTQESSMN